MKHCHIDFWNSSQKSTKLKHADTTELSTGTLASFILIMVGRSLNEEKNMYKMTTSNLMDF